MSEVLLMSFALRLQIMILKLKNLKALDLKSLNRNISAWNALEILKPKNLKTINRNQHLMSFTTNERHGLTRTLNFNKISKREDCVQSLTLYAL